MCYNTCHIWQHTHIGTALVIITVQRFYSVESVSSPLYHNEHLQNSLCQAEHIGILTHKGHAHGCEDVKITLRKCRSYCEVLNLFIE